MNIFLVNQLIDGEDFSARIMTADEIFDMMDMADCYNIQIRVYILRGFEDKPKLCKFRGTWHDPSDPLKMVIEYEGKEIAVGYGTDH